MDTYYVGLDVGSTTIKIAVLDAQQQLVYERYRRHLSDVRQTLADMLRELTAVYRGQRLSVTMTGSGGITAAELMGLSFLQEVVAGLRAVRCWLPQTDVAIELGGEDAKITYFCDGGEQRMNGTCAGGTGAFIDQMAALLDTDPVGLDKLAAEAKVCYPIASRCGVFAKSDIQPLLNQGAARSDIAASVFRSVADQTITGLACGKPIRGKVAFLGGPLHFLPQLRQTFVNVLHLADDEVLSPDKGQLFIAMGAALASREQDPLSAEELERAIDRLLTGELHDMETLSPLFADQAELDAFRARHAACTLPQAELAAATGPCFLGLDAGSTTGKAVLVDNLGRLLYSYYSSNHGSPLDLAVEILRDIYAKLPESAYIARGCVTGYGEDLIRTALKFDDGEVETMAHYRAARQLCPDVDFILDIGGQDMKALSVSNGGLDNILLNEACSSGCGSFIETFAKALGLSAAEFAQVGLLAAHPVDLGSRCTVFMNSRVKQAQKEGASVGDISAGLACSVIKNALFKVIKLRDPQALGQHIVVQGGTFSNEGVLRAFEHISGRQVLRPDQPGLMGAWGAALAAATVWNGHSFSTLLTAEQLADFTVQRTTARCGRCGNNCLLTINRFPDGSRYVSNNRCERGAELPGAEKRERLPNLYDYKYRKLDSYQPLPAETAPRGRIGIPRVLNMYENYPFWFAFWTALGYSVQLSPRSSREIYALGAETMPSESVCYPAKLAHGHIAALLQQGITTIFYPCLPYEQDEQRGGDNHYNCPVVGTYPEVLRVNVPELSAPGVRFISPFLPYDDPLRLQQRLCEELAALEIPAAEVERAVAAAYAADRDYKQGLREQGEAALRWLREHHGRGVVLCGRPYHLDPEINHGIPALIASYGFAVLSEDSVAHLGQLPRPINMVDQWTYHSRLYQAADVVRRTPELELVQLNSFGCGLDALTTDMLQQLMNESGALYTCLKIDEVSNLGAARIRIRSLLAAIEEKERRGVRRHEPQLPPLPAQYTTQMRDEQWTILAPQMSPIHFELVEAAFRHSGYNLQIITDSSPEVVENGLKYVNNDACYPAILTVGQIATALLSGEYDPNRVAVIISQTGGGCRATNYISLLRRMLTAIGMEQIPVLSLNAGGLTPHPGFKLSIPMVARGMMAIGYGDALQRLTCRTRPYELHPGATDALLRRWLDQLKPQLSSAWPIPRYGRNIRAMAREFSAIPISDEDKLRVGLVGEILVKYSPVANNHAVELIEAEGGEAVLPDMLGFFAYSCYDGMVRHDLLAGTKKTARRCRWGIRLIELLQRPMRIAFHNTRFGAPDSIYRIAERAQEVASVGNMCGEGWFLTGEMISLIHEGVEQIVCMQPFACLPNHVVGKGMIRGIKHAYPRSHIVAVDYDPGTSAVNQLNRIRLMMTMAREEQRDAAAAARSAAEARRQQKKREQKKTAGAAVS